ncbi:cob(I)yrinic acid a,c-diamide adenosyltransferase [SAR202 cluster bacterium AD-802-E10_MRT_200m]|nr:cob(I)yrinic acid a,c-diamide adenosyltransferase [SAR202 cluster bacterium AD-802-E10_MRT_200m]
MPKVYTKYGDNGETGLLFGGRVSKNSDRVEAYGAIDEAISALGLARATSNNVTVKEIILRLQQELFTVGAELAIELESYDNFKAHFKPTSSDMIEQMEQDLDSLMEEVKLPNSFIIPGASVASAALDLARTALRRAERKAVGLVELGRLCNKENIRYLNRASDLVFVLARYEDRLLPSDVLTGTRS